MVIIQLIEIKINIYYSCALYNVRMNHNIEDPIQFIIYLTILQNILINNYINIIDHEMKQFIGFKQSKK